ncbi:hypothetical protein [Pseudooceanicola sp.]|uniref:hypothetical protein n=1 Tax=Pseudooceanicola sp. TaxID=1914328 RepID=UPI0035C6DFD4
MIGETAEYFVATKQHAPAPEPGPRATSQDADGGTTDGEVPAQGRDRATGGGGRRMIGETTELLVATTRHAPAPEPGPSAIQYDARGGTSDTAVPAQGRDVHSGGGTIE